MKLNLSSIAIRLPATMAALAIAVAGAIATASFLGARAELETETSERLNLVRDNRLHELETWLHRLESDLVFTRENPTTRSAIFAFISGWEVLGADAPARLSDFYFTKNPHPAGARDKLDAAEDGSSYSQSHQRFHPFFREMKDAGGYDDIFLFDAKGNLIYSVFKKADFATNLLTGPWKDSGLGAAYRRAMAEPEAKPVFVDFTAYRPSAGAAGFLAAMVKAPDGQPLGVIAFQMPVALLDAAVNARDGLGETGHAVLFDTDGQRRSADHGLDKAALLDPVVRTPGVEAALAGGSGILTDTLGDEGVPVIVSYGGLRFLGTDWKLIIEENRAELLAGIHAQRNLSMLLMLAGSLVAVGFGWLFARGLSRPLARLGRRMAAVAGGDFDSAVDYTGRQDEIGTIARNLDNFRSRLGAAELARKMAVFKASAFNGSAATRPASCGSAPQRARPADAVAARCRHAGGGCGAQGDAPGGQYGRGRSVLTGGTGRSFGDAGPVGTPGRRRPRFAEGPARRRGARPGAPRMRVAAKRGPDARRRAGRRRQNRSGSSNSSARDVAPIGQAPLNRAARSLN